MITPGIQTKEVINEEDDLDPEQASRYRALVARANYLAQYRLDIQYATKELCRDMSQPKIRSWTALKRLGRYLWTNPRATQEFHRQGKQDKLTVWVDTDYAGCQRTRKSTSGGNICLGRHVAKAWSATQKVVSLSVGESEYYGLVKGSAMGKGTQSLLIDMGLNMKSIDTYLNASEIMVNTDSSAAKGVASRRGLGKVRHVEV